MSYHSAEALAGPHACVWATRVMQAAAPMNRLPGRRLQVIHHKPERLTTGGEL